MHQTIWDKFHSQVKEQLEELTDIQALLPALCAMERQWQMYLDWTKLESVRNLRIKPEELREPARKLLDLLWEQMWAEEPQNAHREAYDRFINLLESSFDRASGLDVDFGNADTLLEAISCYGYIFFPPREDGRHEYVPGYLRQEAAYCAVNYLYRLYMDYIGPTGSEEAGEPLEPGPELDALAEESPLWQEEARRVLEDLAAAKAYPANKDWFRQRREQYAQLYLATLCRVSTRP